MSEIVAFSKAVGAGIIGVLALLALILFVTVTVSNPWVLIVVVAAAGLLLILGFVYLVHVLVDLIDARRHRFHLRRLEADARRDDLEGRKAERVRIERADAEQFRLQWHAQDVVPLRRGEVLVSRQGNDFRLVYEPPARLPEAQQIVEADPAPLAPIPDAFMVFRAGNLPKGDDLLLGFDAAGVPVVRAWKRVKAILILGLQGGGKTSTAIWLLLQVVLKGGRLGLIDKHARSEDDSMYGRLRVLRAAFDVPVGDTPQAAMRVVQHARKVLDARLAGGHIAYPFVLVVDEFTAIMRQKASGEQWSEVAQKLQGVLEDFNTEGRKHRCFAICIGQAANASRSGGTEVRDLFNTRVVHRMRAKQAQMLALTDYQDEIERLDTGRVCIDMETDEPFFLTVPYANDEVIALVAQSLQRTAQAFILPAIERATPRSPTPAQAFTTCTGPVQPQVLNALPEPALNPRPHSTERLRERTERVLELRQLGVGKQAIVQELWGVKKGGSAGYKQACEEYERIMRLLIAAGKVQEVQP
jgi:hypothetical protein